MRTDRPAASWRMSRLVQGVDPYLGVSVPVVVGLIDTAAGGVQVALRAGDNQPVILLIQDANKLAVILNETTAERLKITGQRFGGDGP